MSHRSINPNLCVEFEYLNVLSISATASNWGRGEVPLAFRAANCRLKTNLRTPNTLLTHYYRASPGVPEATQAPKSDIIGTFINVLSFPCTKIAIFFIRNRRLAIFVENRQFGYFGKILGNLDFFFDWNPSETIIKFNIYQIWAPW